MSEEDKALKAVEDWIKARNAWRKVDRPKEGPEVELFRSTLADMDRIGDPLIREAFKKIPKKDL
jgi:hypothetical protein